MVREWAAVLRREAAEFPAAARIPPPALAAGAGACAGEARSRAEKDAATGPPCREGRGEVLQDAEVSDAWLDAQKTRPMVVAHSSLEVPRCQASLAVGAERRALGAEEQACAAALAGWGTLAAAGEEMTAATLRSKNHHPARWAGWWAEGA